MGLFKRKFIIYKFIIVIERDEVGYFAWTPGWNEIYAYGDTINETIKSIKETAITVIKSYIKHGDPLPGNAEYCRRDIDSDDVIIRELRVSVLS